MFSKHAKRMSKETGFSGSFALTDLLLTSLLSGTAGPTDFPAGGLWGRGEEGLSSSVNSVVTTSTASTCWVGVSAGETNSWGQKAELVGAAVHLY